MAETVTVFKCPADMVLAPQTRVDHLGRKVEVAPHCEDPNWALNSQYSSYQSSDKFHRYRLITICGPAKVESIWRTGNDEKALRKVYETEVSNSTCEVSIQDRTEKNDEGWASISTKPEARLLGIDWDQAKGFCESQGKRLPTLLERKATTQAAKDRAVTIQEPQDDEKGGKFKNNIGKEPEWIADSCKAINDQGCRLLYGPIGRDGKARVQNENPLTRGSYFGVRCAKDPEPIQETREEIVAAACFPPQ